MKKNHLILIALAAIGTINSIHAKSKIEESTEAVLDNNLNKLKQYAAQLSQKELIALLEMAKQKRTFYQTRFNRWEKAYKALVVGGGSCFTSYLNNRNWGSCWSSIRQREGQYSKICSTGSCCRSSS